MRSRLILIILIAFTVGAVVALALRPEIGSGVVQTGKALIGGPFTLINQDGKPVTDQDFRGKYMLIFFGYTYCPDVCPAELQVMAATMDKLGAKADQVTPIFITIDPERDTAEQIGTYVRNFGPRMVGLTGSPAQIKQVAGEYRVYYAKAKGTTGPDDYLMDHSTLVYLMDPKGDYVTHFAYGISADVMAERILKAVSG
jgi:cytochrome oxidase Cu insertion factor (SCO1/SenC/PrrC family)